MNDEIKKLVDYIGQSFAIVDQMVCNAQSRNGFISTEQAFNAALENKLIEPFVFTLGSFSPDLLAVAFNKVGVANWSNFVIIGDMVNTNHAEFESTDELKQTVENMVKEAIELIFGESNV